MTSWNLNSVSKWKVLCLLTSKGSFRPRQGDSTWSGRIRVSRLYIDSNTGTTCTLWWPCRTIFFLKRSSNPGPSSLIDIKPWSSVVSSRFYICESLLHDTSPLRPGTLPPCIVMGSEILRSMSSSLLRLYRSVTTSNLEPPSPRRVVVRGFSVVQSDVPTSR